MDVRDEDGDSQPDKFDFELTNFNPHGSSTRFFKPVSSSSSSAAAIAISKPSVIHEMSEVAPTDEVIPSTPLQMHSQQQRQHQVSTVTTASVVKTEKTSKVAESQTGTASLVPPTSRASAIDEEKTKSEITAAIAANTQSSLKVKPFCLSPQIKLLNSQATTCRKF